MAGGLVPAYLEDSARMYSLRTNLHQWCRALLGGRERGCRGVCSQILPDGLPTAVDTAADGAELHIQGGADLLVGQTFDIAQDHGGTEPGANESSAACRSAPSWAS